MKLNIVPNNKMAQQDTSLLNKIQNLLQQDYRGVNIAVYAAATAGLAYSIHKIRPVSKFSKASRVPEHFIRNHEPLRGACAGVQHSPLRVLVHHQALVRVPLWHASKPPLPVKVWGVEIASGNAVNWLECVAQGKQVTLKPIARDNEDLVSAVLLHLPQAKTRTVETLDIGQRLVELGFATASVPKNLKKNTIEAQLAPALLTAESRARSSRNGIWSEKLPPIPMYVLYWRKGSHYAAQVALDTVKKILFLLGYISKSALVGAKNVALRRYKQTSKVQTT